eukprot:5594262-Pyramimonas_sp.AAC.1
MDLRDGAGHRWCSGLDLLIHGLRRKFMPLEVETAIASMTDLVAFRRRPGEPIDQALARFDLL